MHSPLYLLASSPPQYLSVRYQDQGHQDCIHGLLDTPGSWFQISMSHCDAKNWQGQLSPQARQAAADAILLGPGRPSGPRWLSILFTEIYESCNRTGPPFSWKGSVSQGYCWDGGRQGNLCTLRCNPQASGLPLSADFDGA